VTPFLDPGRFLGWIRERKSLRRISKNLSVLTPWVPIHDLVVLETPLLAQCGNVIPRYQVRQALKHIGAEGHRLITWVYHPYQRHYCQILRQDLLIYEVYDEYHEFAGVRHKKRRVCQIRRNEQIILKKADIALATSTNIHRRLASLHPKVFLIPNGADVDHFANKPQNTSIPLEIENVTRPIIGFVGKINEQIDYPLINQLAINHPEWSLVFLGNFDGQRSLKRDPDFLQAKSNPNIYFLGWRDYAQLPRYVHAFDVFLIPFVINTLTQSVYPLKLHEYLAAGKPVVSTDLPEVRPFEGIVRIAHDQDEFEQQVVAALEERDEELRQRRLAAARENSWERRAETIVRILDLALAERTGGMV
jgi:glycosyltransferase involved in cell wall biosynthesis